LNMGALLGLCTPAGGPCGAEPDGNYEKRPQARPKSNTAQRVPSGSQLDLYESGDSGDDGDSANASVNILESPTDHSSHLMSMQKVAVSPFMARHVINNSLFKSARSRTEAQMLRLSDVDKVEFRDHNWLIQGADAIALENQYVTHKGILDVVIWRIPIIPAFSYFENEADFYELVFNAASPAFVDTGGIWALLSKERFLAEFDEKLLDEIDMINDEQHQYLVHDQHLPQKSGEFEELIVKLKKIEDVKKTNEVVMIGQRSAVKDLLRAVRQKEVQHDTMTVHLRDAWEVHPGDDDAPDPNYITAHSCTVTNLPRRCGQHHIENILEDFERWSYVTMLTDDDDVDMRSPTESPPLSADTPEDGAPDEEQGDRKKRKKKRFKHAMIWFDTKAAMDTFVDAVNDPEGLYVRANKISLLSQEMQQKERHMRWLHDGAMIA